MGATTIEDRNFHTLHIRVGYALRSNKGAMNRLDKKQSPRIVSIDYSFNELVSDISFLEVDGEAQIQTYGEVTLLAEKIRAILQQEERDRSRRQDVYDLYYFLTHHHLDPDKAPLILEELLRKAQSRDLSIDRNSMAAPEIYKRSKREYDSLANEIEGELPDFDLAFSTLKKFYEELPWELV